MRTTLRRLTLLCALALCAVQAHATEYRGTVLFAGLPVPGVTITATQGATRVSVITGSNGAYTFPNLADGTWTITTDMLCFEPETRTVTIVSAPAGVPESKWDLKLLPLPAILASAERQKVELAAAPAPLTPRYTPAKTPEAAKPDAEQNRAAAADGFLINGTQSNAATSQFSLTPAFGNTRSSKNLYDVGLAVIFDNSAFDAAPYSLTGLNTGKPSYNRVTESLSFGGPLNIPHFMPHGPNLFAVYRRTRDRTDVSLPGLVPTAAERTGNLAADPGAPPAVTPVTPATALLALYPLPNIAGNTQYNYQLSARDNNHTDLFLLRLDKSVTPKNQVYGGLELSSARAGNTSLFGFVDTTDTLATGFNVNWVHRFNQRLFQNVGYNFSRLRTLVQPQFANTQNISGQAGILAAPAIGGNDQAARDYGPPTLVFSDGISTLTDGISTFNRNRTDYESYSIQWNRPRHNITAGGDLRRQQFNVLAQSDPRGTYTFTGAATGNALADFLTGIPDAASIAFGNPDKYLRQTVYDLFITDDWRVQPSLTVNYGLRYDYGAPVTETRGRLVNLQITPSNATPFAAVAPVLASAPGTLPTSLIRPDRLGFEPRVGVSWRPIPASTLVIRAGYGVYDDTSVYQASALALAQQAPLSTSLDVSNSASCPLTLAAGFRNCSGITADTFAVDPNFRVGYAQTWQLSAQRDLPAALVGTLTYLGVKGTRGVQEYLPNTYPISAVSPTPTAPVGFVFRSSNGNSRRESVSLQLRRRLRSGFTASAQYTFSKSIDDDSVLGGQGPVAVGAAATAATTGTATVAQDWLHLSAERGLSTFDQRHLLNASAQYTSGQGLGGGALLSGWRGRLLKEWTVVTSIVAGSGLPETPIYLAAEPGTGVTGSIRASRTGAPVYLSPQSAAGQAHLNIAAYTAPAVGQYGSAGRDSIFGPGQFSLNSSLGRTFRVHDKLNLDARIDATNLLNHVTFTAWNTVAGGPSATGAFVPNTTFGLPAAANPQRSLQTTLRLRY